MLVPVTLMRRFSLLFNMSSNSPINSAGDRLSRSDISEVLLSVNKFFNKIYYLNTRPATEFISRDVQDKVLAKRQNV